MTKWKLDGIWNKKSDATKRAREISNYTYSKRIKKTKFKDDTRFGWGVYRKSKL